jgi:hypothetical protein
MLVAASSYIRVKGTHLYLDERRCLVQDCESIRYLITYLAIDKASHLSYPTTMMNGRKALMHVHTISVKENEELACPV